MKKFFLIFLLFLAPLLVGQTSRGGSRCSGGCSFSKQSATPPPLQFTNGNPPNGQTTIPYGAGGSGFPFTTSGGIGAVAFTLGSGSVPAGLTLGLNGGLTGTPTTIQSYTFTVVATDSAVPPHVVTSPSYTVQITSGVPPPVITTTSFPNAMLNVLYGSTAQATNGTQPYTWSQPSGSLPIGVRLNASTGVLSGIPTTPGIYNFTLQVCDINSLCSAVTPFSITVTAPQLQITNAAPPNGQQFKVYQPFPFSSSGGFGTVSWSVVSGSLPTGLMLGLVPSFNTTNYTTNTTSACQNGTAGCNAAFTGLSTASGNTAAQTHTPDPAPLAASTVPISSYLYPGSTAVVDCYYQPWFLNTGGFNGHVNIGMDESQAANVAAQATAMTARGCNTVNIDWYGTDASQAFNLSVTNAWNTYLAAHPSVPLKLAIMLDQGALTPFCPTSTNDQTSCLTTAMEAQFDYIDAHYGEQTYYALDGSSRPLVWYFIDQTQWHTCANFSAPCTNFTTIYNAVQTYAHSHYAKVYQILDRFGSFSEPGIDGTYGWPQPPVYSNSSPNSQCEWDDSTGGTSCNFLTGVGSGTSYVQTLYTACLTNPSKHCEGLLDKGFDWSNASWNGGVQKIIQQGCGQVPGLLAAKINANFSSSTQLERVGWATWNDYEEGTEIETGIDNCARPTLNLTTNTLTYSVNPTDSTYYSNSTVDHLAILFGPNDGSGTLYTALDGIAPSVTVQNLQTLVPTGTWNVYEAMIGKAGIINRLAGPILYSGGTATFSPSTTVLYGTPTVANTFIFMVQAQDSETPPQTVSQQYTLQITASAAPPTIITGTPPAATLNSLYSFVMQGSGGTRPYTWSIISGVLPNGITLTNNLNTGVLSGTATQIGSFPITVQLCDAVPNCVTQPYTFVVNYPALQITNSAPPPGTQGLMYGPFSFTGTGGSGIGYNWVFSGNFPTGLNLNSTTGAVTGIPTGPGVFGFQITLNDNAGNSTSNNYSITINSSLTISPPTIAVNNHEFDADLANPVVTKHIINPSGGDFPYTCAGIQSAIHTAATGTDQAYLILIDPGTIPSVSGNSCFHLEPRGSNTLPSHFIILRSSSMLTAGQVPCAGGLGPETPAGGSVRNLGCATGTDASHFWNVQISSVNSNVIDTTADGSTPIVDSNGNGPSHYVLQGFSASPTTSVTTSNAPLRLGVGSETNALALPSHIHAQYFYIHGDAGDTFTTGTPPGNNKLANDIAFNCQYCSLMWFYMDKSTRPGAEGHGIAIANTVGPTKITNFWIEGNSSGIFHGGQTPAIPNIVASSNEEVRDGTLTYPAAWLGANWGSGNSPTRKNAMEIKEGAWILFDGIVFENVDQTGGQGGPCIGIDTRACSAGNACDNYSAVIHDVIISNSIARGCLGLQHDARSGGVTAGVSSSLGSYNFLTYNNLFYNGPQATYCLGGGSCTPYRWPGLTSETSHWGLANTVGITSISEVGTTATMTTAATAPLNAGASFSISGASVSGYNATWVALTVNGSTVTFTATNGLGSSTGGQVNDASTCSASRSGVTNNTTLICTDGGTGLHQMNILVGDSFAVQNCADTTFNTTIAQLGPPALTGTTGLTVVYNNGSTGAASTTGCTLYTNQGYWNNDQWVHNTFVISSGVAGSTFGPDMGACPINTLSAAYMRHEKLQYNLWAIDQWVGFGGNGAAEGSSGAKPAMSCLDLNTLTYDSNVVAERNAANYTDYVQGIIQTPKAIFTPAAIPCPAGAPTSACVGMAGMVNGAAFNQNPTDFHSFELCGGSGSPVGCPGNSLFAAGQSQQAGDGLDMGANIPQIDAAMTANTYNCNGCSTIFYPSTGDVINVSTTGSDANPGSPVSPIASLDKARQLVAGTDGSLILFGCGFFPSQASTFGSSDSGSLALPIVYAGCAQPDPNDYLGNDQTIISGGITLNSANGFTWTMGPSTCGGTCQEWDLTIPYTTLGSQQPEVMYYNGQRRIRPCAPYNSSTKNCGYYFQSSPDGTHLVTFSSHMSAYFPLLGNAPTGNFECYGCYNRDPADTVATLHAMTGNCTTPGSCTGVQWVEILAFERWTGARMRLVPSFNDGTNTCTTTSITLCATGLTTAAPPNFGPYAGQRYILDNLAPADVPGGPQPGEFYVDPCVVNPSCSAGVESNVKIQYFANPGEHPNTDAPVFPVKTTVFVANGLTNVKFRNFTVSHDNFTVALAGQPGISDASNIQAANSFQNTTGISFDHVNFVHLQHWSLEFVGFNGTPTSVTNIVSNASSWDLGTGNFRFGRIEASGDTCTPTCNIPQFLVVSNSQVSGMQRFMPGGVGLGFWWGNTQNDTGTNLSVSDTYSGAYGVGGSQGYCGTFNTFSGGICTGTNHVFANNIVLTNVTAFNICQGVTSDCGAIHFHSALGTGNVLNGFDFRDVTQDPTNNAFWQGYNGICVYYDNSSSNVVVKRGQCIRASQASVLFNNAVDKNGQNNTMQNVILAYGKQGCIMKAVDSTVFQMTFLNNICYFDQGNSHNGPQFEGGSAWLTPTLWSMSHNTYFNPTTSLGTGTPWYQTVGMSRNYLAFSGWQALNSNTNDSSSTNTINPNFVNPTCAGGDNYQFTSGAPSGFSTFSVSAFGAQGLPALPSVPETFKLQTQNCNTFF